MLVKIAAAGGHGCKANIRGYVNHEFTELTILPPMVADKVHNTFTVGFSHFVSPLSTLRD